MGGFPLEEFQFSLLKEKTRKNMSFFGSPFVHLLSKKKKRTFGGNRGVPGSAGELSVVKCIQLINLFTNEVCFRGILQLSPVRLSF